MGILKMPHRGRRLIGKLLFSDTDPNRARDAIHAEYLRKGGKPNSVLAQAYKDYKAAQIAHERERTCQECDQS